MKMIEWKSRCNHVMMNRRPVPPTDDMVRLTLIDYLRRTISSLPHLSFSFREI